MKVVPGLSFIVSFVLLSGNIAAAEDVKPGGITVLQEPAATMTYGRMAKIKAAVEALDLDAREITLKGRKGRSVTLHVEERVKNLPEVQIGDEVTVRYYESVALELRKAQEGDAAAPDEAAAKSAEPGKKMGAAAVKTLTIIADVDAVSPKGKTVTLKGPNGDFVDLYVRDLKVLESVAAGDKVIATFTEAAAVSVETPKEKEPKTKKKKKK